MSLSAWTHHQLLKATAPVNFSQGRLSKGATNKAALNILKEATRARNSYLEQVGNPATSAEIVVRSCTEYCTILIGLLELPAPSGGDDTEIPISVRARKSILFKWRDVLSGEIVELEDIRGELICTLLNCGLWHCLHASRLMDSSAEDDEDAQKNIYRALLAAASYFDYVDTDQLPKFKWKQMVDAAIAHDLDPRLVKCLAEQLLAEAQEVTCTRARVKGHADELIAAIAMNEKERFTEAKQHIDGMEAKLVEDIWSYFDFKIDYYHAMALCYNGEHLFKQEKCGMAIKCYREAAAKFEKCKETAQAYSKKRSKRKSLSKSTVKDVTESATFLSLGKKIKSSLEKAEHENGFIYKEKIPADLPELIASKSLINKKPLDSPEASIAFSEATFDASKIPIRGKDHSADTASSDHSKVEKSGPHHAKGMKDDSLCSLM